MFVLPACAQDERLTVSMVVMHFVSDFTECIPIPINIKTSKQIQIPPFTIHLSIVVYLATASGVLGLSVYF